MSGEVPEAPTIRVLLVDDHALVREGIRQILEKEPDIAVIGETERGDLALELLDRLQPDVVLLGVRMPGMSGVETTRRIRAAFPKIRVLILSAYADFAVEAFRAGASGYVLKSARSSELIAALRSVFLGSTVIQGALAEGLVISGSGGKSRGTDLLSPREAQILRLIARGLTNRTIAREIGIAPRTADQHVHNILIKVGVRSRAEAVRYAVEHELAAPTEASAG
jgi:Response regulator containing a CheY-like receiver domain and an HTH DNA-binding domain